MRWAVLVGIALATPVRAQTPTTLPRVHVESEGECPSAALLEAALVPLLGRRRVALDGEASTAGASEPVQALVSDMGDRYVIEIVERKLHREVEERAHDCVERARVAAVLIALNLGEGEPTPATQDPPVVEAQPLPPVKRPATQARREGSSSGEASSDASDDESSDDDESADEEPPQLEEEEEEVPLPPEPFAIGMLLLGTGELATAIERGAFGGSVGVWVREAGFGVALDAGLLSPVTLLLEPRGATRGRAALMRVPLTLSVHYLLRVGSFRFGPALGMAMDVLRVSGDDVERAQTAVRASFGGFAALEAHALLGAQLEAVLRLHLRAFPKAYQLAVPPEGALGETPKLWLGASLGLAWRFL